MTWEEYKEEVKSYRIECSCSIEYISILLLGISEEIEEYRKEVSTGGYIENQISEYGDILFNIAELANVIEEEFPAFPKSKYTQNIIESIAESGLKISAECTKAVRKHYMRDKNYSKLLFKASAIQLMCNAFYVVAPISKEAMKNSVNKMKRRHCK